MKYREFRPSVKYEGFIKAFWSLEGGAAYSHYSLADACPELLFHYKGIFDEVFANNRTDKTFSSGVTVKPPHRAGSQLTNLSGFLA